MDQYTFAQLHARVLTLDDARIDLSKLLSSSLFDPDASGKPVNVTGHSNADKRDRVRGEQKAPQREVMICSGCGVPGHLLTECRKSKGGTVPVTCHKCGKTGHLSSSCPQSVPGPDGPLFRQPSLAPDAGSLAHQPYRPVIRAMAGDPPEAQMDADAHSHSPDPAAYVNVAQNMAIRSLSVDQDADGSYVYRPLLPVKVKS